MEAFKYYRFVTAIIALSVATSSFPSYLFGQSWPGGNGPIASMAGMGRPQNSIRTPNFIIISSDPAFSAQVAQAAERQRHELAVYWLGAPLPNWPQPCPITVVAGAREGAGGSTTFSPGNGTIRNWRMNVKGSQERILDSVLPHEITHTVLATHFAPMNKLVPRWADEGACTTVEHGSERSKHDQFLVRFLSSGRGIPFATMFTLKDYPSDIMPLYAQGYSVTSFLIAQGGPQTFVKFLEAGLTTDDWVTATETHYGYPMIGKLQTAWNKWVYDGGGDVAQHTADALMVSKRSQMMAANAASQPVRVASASSPRAVSLDSEMGGRSSSNSTSNSSMAAIGRPSSGGVNSGDTSWYRKQLNPTTRDQSQGTSQANATTIPAEPPSLGLSSNGQVSASLTDTKLASNVSPSARGVRDTAAFASEEDYSVGHQQSPQSMNSMPVNSMQMNTAGGFPSELSHGFASGVPAGLSSGVPVGQSFFR